VAHGQSLQQWPVVGGKRQLDSTGAANKFREALEKQLGLIDNETKLQKRPMPVLVVDHVEMPTPN
jgi:uncharacterized protein (TIGR03435 family)